MRKIGSILCLTACFLIMIGCHVQTNGTALLPEGTVESIRVSSLPERYNYSFHGAKTKPIITYLENLALQSDFSENPDEYNGMTYVITITYENGTEWTLYHFGNQFIRSQDSDWYAMEYEEASRLKDILEENQANP